MARKLFFGEYLVNRGLVTEEQVLEALEAQRRQTPAFEKMALRLSLLNMKQVFLLLTAQASTDLSFPELAVRDGYLSADQAVFVLENIDRERPPLGDMLVELGTVSRPDMEGALEAYEEHKRQFADIADLLSRIEFFRRLDERALRSLSYIAERQLFKAGERVVVEGDPADGFYCVASGYLRITKANPHPGNGGEEVYLGNIGPEDVFGESSIFEEARRTAHVGAEVDSVLLRIGRKEFLHFLKEHPLGAQSVLIFIIQRLLEKLSFANKELAYERQHFLAQQQVESVIDEFFS
ncbi:cyclic nucleotide-binding domain-containing protein [Endothiovibrio diazotrophicus]